MRLGSSVSTSEVSLVRAPRSVSRSSRSKARSLSGKRPSPSLAAWTHQLGRTFSPNAAIPTSRPHPRLLRAASAAFPCETNAGRFTRLGRSRRRGLFGFRWTAPGGDCRRTGRGIGDDGVLPGYRTLGSCGRPGSRTGSALRRHHDPLSTYDRESPNHSGDLRRSCALRVFHKGLRRRSVAAPPGRLQVDATSDDADHRKRCAAPVQVNSLICPSQMRRAPLVDSAGREASWRRIWESTREVWFNNMEAPRARRGVRLFFRSGLGGVRLRTQRNAYHESRPRTDLHPK